MGTMKIAALPLTVALVMVLVPVSMAAPLRADQARVATGVMTEAPSRSAPEAWSRQDPADSLYRAARDAMNGGDYARAADLFRSVWQRHPRSAYAPDAPYWEAFNRYRTGETRDLERALEALALQEQRYARAPSRESGEAAALATRINGMLARRGDVASARAVVAQANEIVGEASVAAGRLALEGVRVQLEGSRAAIEGTHRALEGALRVPPGGRIGDVPAECREQVEMQVAALNALIHMNADRAMPVLRQVMARRDECSPPLRRRAVFLIADKGRTEAVDLLIAAARTDPDMEVRRQAVFWLSEVRDDRAVAALQEFVLRGDDEQLRDRAVFALAQHGGPRAMATLRGVVQDTAMPARLRSRAIFWLGQEGSAEDVAFLRGLFGRMGDPTLDERILFAVSQSSGADNTQWLLATAMNERVDIELRKKAVFWAGQAGASARELGGIYDRIQDPAMRERVLFALSQSSQPEAVERLIHIARTERDIELRKKAIFWLGHSNDPRAADVLLELLANPSGGR